MAQVDDAALKTAAQQIKNETAPLANTANRVGTNLENLGDSKMNNGALVSSGTAVKFDVGRLYGASSPETGNITLDATGACVGMTQIMRHNSTPAPTFSAAFKQISPNSYVPGVINYITFLYISSSEVLYSISQVQ